MLELLIDSFNEWLDVDEAFDSNVRGLWSCSHTTKQIGDAITSSRRICTEQRIPLPETMVDSIFDDPSFDFTAYLAWHNSDA